jgi:hypothetical protein
MRDPTDRFVLRAYFVLIGLVAAAWLWTHLP